MALPLRNRTNPARWARWSGLFLGLTACLAPATAAETGARRSHFRGWTDFAGWHRAGNRETGAIEFVSPAVPAPGEWNELIVSWNAATPGATALKFEARALDGDRVTKFYTLGLWASDPTRQPRESVRDQRDEDGDVQTDTLVLTRPAKRAQVRVTLQGTGDGLRPQLRFLGLSLLDSRIEAPAGAPLPHAWGRRLEVPERAQANYPGGAREWCSPTSVSMVLAYWARTLARPGLDQDVPAVVAGVYDRNWPGTGNWPFNTAFAGSLPGLRAYVTRLTEVAELEAWVLRGVPVVVSVCYDLLRGRPRERDSGHLVVCVGFTPDGQVIVNDPGTRENVRKTFPRENLVRAWAVSKNTVYLIYPEGLKPPKDRLGHWHSKAD